MNNNKIKLAVAGAVMSAASVANAGIIIPAGDWTLDINGNVNAFATWTNIDSKGTGPTGAVAAGEDAHGEDSTQSINTGLLPSWLGFTGTTRQNDVDVSFTISFQPNASDNAVSGDVLTPLNRQAFVTFGDKSWGTVKLGKDLGVFGGQAILNDMTLLGVGGRAATVSGAQTSLGGIGTGYIYPAWKGQIAYTTPNMNGFSATIAITNPNQGSFGAATTTTDTAATLAGMGASSASAATASLTTTGATELYQDRFGIEGQLMYEWTGDVAGKVWASGASYDVTVGTAANTSSATEDSYTAHVYDIGAAITSGNLGLVGYYYNGEGVGTTMMGGWLENTGVRINGNRAQKRDSDGGYLQATYVIPTGTKLGVTYGVSNLDEASGENNGTLIETNERWTVGAYHPLTKHLNLVAEYNSIESEGQSSANELENDSFSLGAILFF
ncbi:porin [Methylophilaceae bacterium]|nr:porin [Methylophilaceae bacterium]